MKPSEREARIRYLLLHLDDAEARLLDLKLTTGFGFVYLHPTGDQPRLLELFQLLREEEGELTRRA